jgi:tRNA (mo5U34)-methyltransferase
MKEVQQAIEALGPWFHNIHLPDGTQTAPNHNFGDFPSFKWDKIKQCIPEDLSGWKALDIGCNAGFYSIELARRGAEVLAIDLDEHYLKQAEWVVQQFGLEKQINFRKMQVYDLSKLEEKFDLIWFMGVFYHLRYPMLALDIIAQKVNRMLVFQTLSMPGKEILDIPNDLKLTERNLMLEEGFPKMAFIEKSLAGDHTNWWAPNHQGILSMLRSCGLQVTSMPEDETYLAIKDSALLSPFNSWNYSEYLSATGKDWKGFDEKKVGRKG